ncbi:MAG: RICIN domain-containing protein [Oscillospiraceae bacterium]|nr:RICIN domain-containing protein [Oscillospiraceae bacterium]
MKTHLLRRLVGGLLAVTVVFGVLGDGMVTKTEAALSTKCGGAQNGVYYIRNKRTNLFLDVNNSGGHNAKVKQFTYNGKPAQQWEIFDEKNGHSLAPRHNLNLRLHVDNAWGNGEQAVVQNVNNNSAAQRFRLPLVRR